MAKSFEDGLRRFVVSVGNLCESGINELKKALLQVETRSGLKPILSLESQLSADMLRKLTTIGEERIFHASIPNLSGKQALELCEGPAHFLPRLLQLGSSNAIGLEIDREVTGRKQGDASRGFIVKGALEALPFAAESFDYLVARLATAAPYDLLKGLQEMTRVLVSGGQGVLVDYHPFGLYAKPESHRPRSFHSPLRGFEDYFKACRGAGLRIIEVREVFLEEEMRKFFPSEEIAAYRHLKGTPLVACFFIYKPRKKS